MNLVNEVVHSQYSVVPLKPGREEIKRRTEVPASTRALRISLKFCTNEARIYTGLNARFRRMLVSRSEMSWKL